MKIVRSLLLVLLVMVCACGSSQGPRVRYANASPQELAAAENEPVVWYEFQPGDQVPVDFAFLGMAEMGAERLRMVVQRPFWIVVHQNGHVNFSFDNRRQVANPFSRWGFLIGEGDRRGRTGLVMYVGPAHEAPAQLR